MKTLFALILMISSTAFAGVCDYSYTFDIDEAIDRREIQVLRTSDNHSNFSKLEKSMILETVKMTTEETDLHAALELFADVWDDSLAPGPNAGEIRYMMDSGELIALVHFWPGDTEVGMMFRMKGNSFSPLAVIGDSEIDCN